MNFTLLSFLFFSLIAALGAPMGYRRSAVHDELVTELVTITITATPSRASKSLPISAPPHFSSSSQAPRETAPSRVLLNAQEAQRLNSRFRNLKLTDACPTGDSACIEGEVVQCVDERWIGPVGTPCSGSEQCFAVPVASLTDAGTKLVCISEQTAAFIMKAAGADGGVFGGQ